MKAYDNPSEWGPAEVALWQAARWVRAGALGALTVCVLVASLVLGQEWARWLRDSGRIAD